MTAAVISHKFNVHHIFPREVFADLMLASKLNALFVGQPDTIDLDMMGNKIALFTDPAQASMVQSSIISGDLLHSKSGFGGSQHGGSHPGYNGFVKTKLSVVLNSGLTDNQKITAIFDLHRFLTDVSQGVATQNGLPGGNLIGVVGAAPHEMVLSAAYDNVAIDPTAPDALNQNGLGVYISNFNNSVSDVGSPLNIEARKAFAQQYADEAFNQGFIEQAQYDNAQAAINNGHPGAAIYSLGVDVANPNIGANSFGGIQSPGSQFQGSLVNFASDTSGSAVIPDFDKLAGALGTVGASIDAVGNSLPSSFNDFGPGAVSGAVGSFNGMIAGVGGGFVGDTAEFLNLSYDSIKEGIATGDWGAFQADVANYGVSAALSAAAIVATTAAAGVLLGPVAAAVVGGAWAAYGIYDGIVNMAELFGKVLDDISESGLLPPWAQAIADYFNPPPVDPLVVDLDGDGIELTALVGSNVQFDLDDDGFAELTGWVAPDDALLAIDTNSNGTIDSINELFGSQTETGYQQLAVYDQNSDGSIDASDAQFGSLLLWQDLNADGVSQAGELGDLLSLGIQSISLNASASSLFINGNQVLETASVTMMDGTVTLSGEVLFNLSQIESTFVPPNGFALDDAVFQLPNLKGLGEVPDLWIKMTLDPTMLTDVSNMITTLRTGSYAGFDGDISAIIFKWADVENYIWSVGNPTSGLSAKELGLMQKIMGQEYGSGTSGPDYILTTVLTPQEAAELKVAYDAFADAMAAQLMVQSVWSIISAEGVAADVGSLSPLRNLQVDLVTQSITGDQAKFAVEFVQMFRDSSSGTDFEALSHLSKFLTELPHLGVFVAGAYPDISRPDIENLLNINIVNEGGVGDDTIAVTQSGVAIGGDGNDLIQGSTFASTIYSGLGDDSLNGGSANDTYLYSLGDGHDVIDDGSNGSGVVHDDRLVFVNVTVDDVSFANNSNDDLVITLSDGGSVTVLDHFFSGYRDMEYIEFSDGTVLGWKEIRDKTVADQKDVGAAVIKGSYTAETYFHTLGDGSYSIDDGSNGGGGFHDDRLVLTDVIADQVDFANNANNDLVITLPNAETITIVNHFFSGYRDMEYIEFSDGTVLGWKEIRDKTVADQKDAGAAVIKGSYTAETYYHTQGDGSYSIDDGSNGDGGFFDDRLVFTDALVDEVIFANITNDLVITLPNTESVTVLSHFSSGYRDMEYIEFSDGTVLDLSLINSKTIGDSSGTYPALTGATQLADILAGTVNIDAGSLLAGDDSYFAGGGNDTILGDGGNDTVNGDDGNDLIFGGDGNDLLDGGAGIDQIYGGNGSDTITGSVGDDYYLAGGSGSDLISGGGGNDTLSGGAGNDTLNGGSHNDLLSGGSDDDQLLGDTGQDTINGGDGDDLIIGGGDGDIIDGGGQTSVGDTASYSNSDAAVNINFEAGTASGGHAEGDVLSNIENLFGSNFDDVLTGGNGNNAITGFGGNDTIDGGGGNDSLEGGQGDDVFISGLGADTINGGAGTSDTADYSASDAAVVIGTNNGAVNSGGHAAGDVISTVTENLTGSSFGDQITGNTLSNVLIGGAGDDTMNAGSGDDMLLGESGNDLLFGSRGKDTIDGGTGNDTASWSNTDAGMIIDLSTNFANGSGHAGGDALISIENVIGGQFNDLITGNGGANLLNGLSGNDNISGLGGNDTLQGSNGADTLNGGTGDDLLTGSGGVDRFDFDTASFGDDTITGFANGLEFMDFRGSGLTFTDLTITTGGTSTVVSVTASPTNQITLNGITSVIDASDFLF